MTMRITMRQTRMGESGSLLDSGSTYTVSDAFGAAMVGATYATDTDGVLSSPKATGLQDMKYNPLTQSAVSGDGTQWLIPGAATFTASDAGTDWYRVPDVLQIAAVLDSGTSTTVLVEVRTAAGVVSTALTITADTVAQVLRSSILTMEMHEFRIRRSSGTGTVTITV
jgi:hypothetical protein